MKQLKDVQTAVYEQNILLRCREERVRMSRWKVRNEGVSTS